MFRSTEYATSELERETLEIIMRHRPEFAGKTLEECREILAAQYPRKTPTWDGRSTKEIKPSLKAAGLQERD